MPITVSPSPELMSSGIYLFAHLTVQKKPKKRASVL